VHRAKRSAASSRLRSLTEAEREASRVMFAGWTCLAGRVVACACPEPPCKPGTRRRGGPRPARIEKEAAGFDRVRMPMMTGRSREEKEAPTVIAGHTTTGDDGSRLTPAGHDAGQPPAARDGVPRASGILRRLSTPPRRRAESRRQPASPCPNSVVSGFSRQVPARPSKGDSSAYLKPTRRGRRDRPPRSVSATPASKRVQETSCSPPRRNVRPTRSSKKIGRLRDLRRIRAFWGSRQATNPAGRQARPHRRRRAEDERDHHRPGSRASATGSLPLSPATAPSSCGDSTVSWKDATRVLQQPRPCGLGFRPIVTARTSR